MHCFLRAHVCDGNSRSAFWLTSQAVTHELAFKVKHKKKGRSKKSAAPKEEGPVVRIRELVSEPTNHFFVVFVVTYGTKFAGVIVSSNPFWFLSAKPRLIYFLRSCVCFSAANCFFVTPCRCVAHRRQDHFQRRDGNGRRGPHRAGALVCPLPLPQ